MLKNSLLSLHLIIYIYKEGRGWREEGGGKTL